METVMLFVGMAPQIIACLTAVWAIVEKVRGRNAVAATAEAYKLLDVMIASIDKMPDGALKEAAKQHLAKLSAIAGTESQVNAAVKSIEALLKANGLWGNEDDQEMTRRSISFVAEIKRKGAKRL